MGRARNQPQATATREHHFGDVFGSRRGAGREYIQPLPWTSVRDVSSIEEVLALQEGIKQTPPNGMEQWEKYWKELVWRAHELPLAVRNQSPWADLLSVSVNATPCAQAPTLTAAFAGLLALAEEDTRGGADLALPAAQATDTVVAEFVQRYCGTATVRDYENEAADLDDISFLLAHNSAGQYPKTFRAFAFRAALSPAQLKSFGPLLGRGGPTIERLRPFVDQYKFLNGAKVALAFAGLDVCPQPAPESVLAAARQELLRELRSKSDSRNAYAYAAWGTVNRQATVGDIDEELSAALVNTIQVDSRQLPLPATDLFAYAPNQVGDRLRPLVNQIASTLDRQYSATSTAPLTTMRREPLVALRTHLQAWPPRELRGQPALQQLLTRINSLLVDEDE